MLDAAYSSLSDDELSELSHANIAYVFYFGNQRGCFMAVSAADWCARINPHAEIRFKPFAYAGPGETAEYSAVAVSKLAWDGMFNECFESGSGYELAGLIQPHLAKLGGRYSRAKENFDSILALSVFSRLCATDFGYDGKEIGPVMDWPCRPTSTFLRSFVEMELFEQTRFSYFLSLKGKQLFSSFHPDLTSEHTRRRVSWAYWSAGSDNRSAARSIALLDELFAELSAKQKEFERAARS
jgi:hypothetical protein